MRRVLLPLALAATSCVPAPSPAPCHTVVDHLWPEGSRAWAHRIVERESRGIETARNKSSSASGCFQLIQGHAERFRKFGYTWDHDRFNARANVTVALDLFLEQGTRPWRLTSY